MTRDDQRQQLGARLFQQYRDAGGSRDRNWLDLSQEERAAWAVVADRAADEVRAAYAAWGAITHADDGPWLVTLSLEAFAELLRRARGELGTEGKSTPRPRPAQQRNGSSGTAPGSESTGRAPRREGEPHD